MDWFGVLAYCTVLSTLTIAPGPLTAVLFAKTIGGNQSGAYAFGLGVAVGDTSIILLICAGLGAWVQSVPEVFVVGKGLAVLFVLWISFGMLTRSQQGNRATTAGGDETDLPCRAIKGTAFSSLIAGLLMCVVSPQTILLYVALIPGVLDLSNLQIESVLMLIVFTFFTLLVTMGAIVYFAERIRKCLAINSENTRLTERIVAGVVALTGISMILI